MHYIVHLHGALPSALQSALHCPLHGASHGLLQALGFLAFAVGPAVGGLLAQRGGPALPFYLLGAALLLSAPLKARLPETHYALA